MLTKGSYPCLLGSGRLHEDEVSVCQTEGACHKLPRLVMLTQQHSLHLYTRVRVFIKARNTTCVDYQLTLGVFISWTRLTGPSSRPVAELTNLLFPTATCIADEAVGAAIFRRSQTECWEQRSPKKHCILAQNWLPKCSSKRQSAALRESAPVEMCWKVLFLASFALLRGLHGN